jgi:hypothetical protein
MLAVADGAGGRLSLWEVVTGQQWAEFPADGHIAECLAFSPNSRFLAVGTKSGEILIWDLARGAIGARLTGHRGRVASVAYSPTGDRLVSVGDDNNLLLWDVAARLVREKATEVALPAKELESLWRQLACDDAEHACSALARLVMAPQSAVACMRQRLVPVTNTPVAQIRAWVVDLDSDRFATRQQAMAELIKLGELGVPVLQKTLAVRPTLEVRRRIETILAKIERRPATPQELQLQRALLVLEMLGTAESRQQLEALARGAPDAWLTEQAKAACRRLE